MASMARRPDDVPVDPVIVVIEEPEPTMTFDEWLALVATDEPVELDIPAADLIRELREHGER